MHNSSTRALSYALVVIAVGVAFAALVMTAQAADSTRYTRDGEKCDGIVEMLGTDRTRGGYPTSATVRTVDCAVTDVTEVDLQALPDRSGVQVGDRIAILVVGGEEPQAVVDNLDPESDRLAALGMWAAVLAALGGLVIETLRRREWQRRRDAGLPPRGWTQPWPPGE